MNLESKLDPSALPRLRSEREALTTELNSLHEAERERLTALHYTPEMAREEEARLKANTPEPAKVSKETMSKEQQVAEIDRLMAEIDKIESRRRKEINRLERIQFTKKVFEDAAKGKGEPSEMAKSALKVLEEGSGDEIEQLFANLENTKMEEKVRAINTKYNAILDKISSQIDKLE